MRAPPHFLIRPRTMHDKRALDRQLCRKRERLHDFSRNNGAASTWPRSSKHLANKETMRRTSCTSTGFRAFGGARTLTNYHPLAPRPPSLFASETPWPHISFLCRLSLSLIFFSPSRSNAPSRVSGWKFLEHFHSCGENRRAVYLKWRNIFVIERPKGFHKYVY